MDDVKMSAMPEKEPAQEIDPPVSMAAKRIADYPRPYTIVIATPITIVYGRPKGRFVE